jgi:selenide,water dikinase
MQKSIVCDPQTSGGLLITVTQSAKSAVREILKEQKLSFAEIGEICASEAQEKSIHF